MPRKAFVADLREAIQTLNFGSISGLAAGNEDASFVFTHNLSEDASAALNFEASVTGKTTDHSATSLLSLDEIY